MGWFTKNKDKKKKEEEEKKKKEAQELELSNNKKQQQEEQKQQDNPRQQPQQLQQQRQSQQSQQYPPNQNPQQVDLIKEEDVWIFESIIQFLVSPVFKAPVHQLVDDKCMYFENTKDISNDHKEIYKDYKNLMDQLVIGLSQDIGVEPDKIMEICELGLNLKAQRKYFIYFQIYYHFDDFIKTMAKRNVDLEQEAFHQMQKRNSGQNPQQQRGGHYGEDDYEMAIKNSLSNTQVAGGDKELQKAILASQQEFENKKKLQDQEDEMLQQALILSKMESGSNKSKIEQGNPNHHAQSKKISKPEQKKNDDDDDLIQINDSDDDADLDDGDDDNLYFDFKKETSTQPLQQKPDQNFDKMLFESRQNLLKNLDNLNNDSSNPSSQQQKEETLEERKERLKKQREMLLEKKRMERANELDEYADKQIQHQEMLMQDEEDDTKSQMEIKKKKELVNKIKAEIAGNK